MGGELRYEIGQSAYVKLVLHALKHRTSAVNGILLGRLIKDDFVEILDVVPLSHSQIGLLPPLEIALILIEEFFGAQGMRVVGYYQANERFDDLELRCLAKNIGDHICRYFPQAALLLLDNEKLEALPKGMDRSPVLQKNIQGAMRVLAGHDKLTNCVFVFPVCHLYMRDVAKTWKQDKSRVSSRLTFKEPSANVVLLDYISSDKWLDIVDFDDHLEDISKDWLNAEFFK